MTKSLVLIIIVCLTAIDFAQQYGRGLLLEPEYYSNSPKAAPLMRGDFFNLPTSFSIKEYCPTPGSQGSFSTCAGWAAGYAARTIVEALANRWNKELVDQNTFSPSYVYNSIRKDKDCEKGVSLIDVLEILKAEGTPKFSEFGYDCQREILPEDKENASRFKIKEYREIFSRNEKNKVLITKKSITEYNPVLIALDAPESFNFSSTIWTPLQSDYKNWSRGHALVIVAYDDQFNGGAFQVANSWGTAWGDGGFTWIKYSDFEYFCHYAFEIIGQIQFEEVEYDLSGQLSFVTDAGKPMKSFFNGQYFQMVDSYESGTKFELFLSNNEPAYIYAFSCDLTYKPFKIFPFNEGMTALLPYKKNSIAIPDNEHYNILDDVKGTSYYCFIYSKESIDIDQLLAKIEKDKGKMWDRISKKFISDNDLYSIKQSDGEVIKFEAKSSETSIVLILVEIKHI